MQWSRDCRRLNNNSFGEALIYSVNIIFRNCASALSLSYKAHKNADEARNKVQKMLCNVLNSPISGENVMDISDDYDQICSVDMSTVSAVSMGDIEKDLDRQGEVGLLQTKAQLRAQTLANNDAGLRMLSGASKSPIIKGN